MAIQQLTQPIINPIAAFDATQNHVVTFLAIGGAQVVGNRIVISDNQTGETVYDNRVITMQLAHTIPANTLTNGGYYNVVIYTIDSANNFSQASVPVPFYCYSQPTLTINNIPASSTIENGTYTFQGSYAQQENEILNSYQFILYDSNKTVLSQSDVIYYSSNNSLSYTFVGMSNDTSYYIELKGQTVNNTEITTGLLYFTVRYSQPASFAIVDLVNDCENGFIQISSNIVAIDGKSNPEPPIYIDDKEVDLREPDSWVRWDEGFNIKDDFTMRVWGRDFNDFEPIITLSNKNNTDSEPNKIEMKWMIADVMKILPDYTLVSGKNISIVDGYKTDINDLAIYGNSEQIKKDSIDFGTANSMTIDTTEDMYLDVDVYGNQYQKTQEGSKKSASGEEIYLTDVDAEKPGTITKINGNQYQATREGYNKIDLSSISTEVTGIKASYDNETGYITFNGTPTANYPRFFSLDITDMLNDGEKWTIWQEKAPSGTDKEILLQVIERKSTENIHYYSSASSGNKTSFTVDKTQYSYYLNLLGGTIANIGTLTNYKNRYMLYKGTEDKPYEQYGASPSPDYPSKVETVGSNVNDFDLISYYNTAPVVNATKQLLNNGIKLNFEAKADAYIGTVLNEGETLNENWRSGCVAVEPNATYTIQVSSAPKCYISYLDENYKAIRGFAQFFGNVTFTTDAHTHYFYLRFGYSNRTSDLTSYEFTNIKVEKGSVATPYSPYNQGSVEVKVINKNWLTNFENINNTNSGITMVGNKDNVKVTGTATKDWVSSNYAELGNLQAGNYIFSYSSEQGLRYKIWIYNSEKSAIIYNLGLNQKISVPKNYKKLFFRIILENLTAGQIVNDTAYFQIEKGSTSTDIVKHQSQTAIMPIQQEMLTGDYIRSVEHHEWKKLVLMGDNVSGRWTVDGGNEYRFVIAVDNMLPASSITEKTNIICNTLKTVSVLDTYNKIEGIAGDKNSNILIYIEECKDMTVEEFKAYLNQKYNSGTPVTIYYKLATPLNLELTGEQKTVKTKLTNMTLYQGVTNITNQSSYPAILDLDYNIVPQIPSPDYPSEVETVGDNLNLLDIDKTTYDLTINLQKEGEYLKGNNVNNIRIGTFNDSRPQIEEQLKSGSYTISYEIEANSNVTLQNLFFCVIFEDDTQENIASGKSYSLEKGTKQKVFWTLNVQKNFKKMGIVSYLSNSCDVIVSKVKIEKGLIATPYSPYRMGSVKIDIVNKNYLTKAQQQTKTFNNVNFEINENGEINIQGLANASGEVTFELERPCKMSDLINNIVELITEGTPVYSIGMRFLDGNARLFELIPGTKIVTLDLDESYIDKSITAIQFYINNTADYNLVIKPGIYAEFQTEFTPHQSQIAIMPIQQEMLTGDYVADVEHHEWKKSILTGEEELSSNFNINGSIFFGAFISDKDTNNGEMVCNNYLYQPNKTWQQISNYGFCGQKGSNNVFIRDDRFTTKTDFLNYLKQQYEAGTPVTISYKLATPVNLELIEEQKTIKNTLINAYEPITNVYASDDLPLLKVYTTPIPSPKLPSKIYSSGDKKNQLKDLGIINIDYTQGYFKTTDTDFILKPDFVYNLSFDYIVNNTTTDLYFTVSYKNNGEIFDITNASQYTNKTTGRNNISFIVPADIPANSTLSIKFARTIIQADVSVSVNNVALVKGRFAADYQSSDIYNIYPTATQKNIFNYNDIYYIKNQNTTLTFIQNGFSSEVVTTGEKSFFEFGFPNILQPGNKYAISYNSYGAIKSAKVYTMDKETGKTLEQIVTENGVFTAPSNLYDIKAEFILDDSVADNQVQVWNIQLESGEQVTEAETYTVNNTDLTLEQPLRGIENYRDLACLESPNILNPETQTAIVKGSTTYTLSQSGTTAYKFDYINEDNNIISSENMASGQFTTPDNCIRIKFDTTSDIITTNKLQVNLGNTAMVYYPYVNEPSIIRYIGEVVLTGDEEWSRDLFNKYAFVLQNIRILDCMLPIWGKSNIQICSHFKVGTPGYDTENTNCFSINNGGVLVFQYEISRTTEEWKAYLKQQYEAGTPVIVNYVLANPTVEQLSSDNILALQNLKTYEGISNVFTNNSMPANLNLSYISGQSKQETKNAYVTLKCWNGNVMPYFIHSNYIDIPKETDKIFIWLRRKNNIFDLKIENLGDYGEDKPGNKGNPQVAITVDDTTTTTITITANTIDTATLSNVRFSKDNGATWDAEIPLDGLSSTDTYTFTGLQPATTYQIRVEATNVNGITGGITQQVITRAS